MLMKSSELFACEHMCLHVRVHVHTHTHTHTQSDGIRKCIGHEGGAFTTVISALIKEAPERCLAPFHLARTQ